MQVAPSDGPDNCMTAEWFRQHCQEFGAWAGNAGGLERGIEIAR